MNSLQVTEKLILVKNNNSIDLFLENRLIGSLEIEKISILNEDFYKINSLNIVENRFLSNIRLLFVGLKHLLKLPIIIKSQILNDEELN